MGKMKETPRYNIVSLRISDDELHDLKQILGRRNVSDFLRDAMREKMALGSQAAPACEGCELLQDRLIASRQAAFDELVRARLIAPLSS